MNIKTLIYKKRLGRYDCVKITNGDSKGIRIVFEEPIDGKITIGNYVARLSRGVAEIDTARLSDGKISPKLYSGGKIYALEDFILYEGRISTPVPDSEYIRRIYENLDSLSERVSILEEKNEEIMKKMSQTLNF